MRAGTVTCDINSVDFSDLRQQREFFRRKQLKYGAMLAIEIVAAVLDRALRDSKPSVAERCNAVRKTIQYKRQAYKGQFLDMYHAWIDMVEAVAWHYRKPLGGATKVTFTAQGEKPLTVDYKRRAEEQDYSRHPMLDIEVRFPDERHA